MFDPLTYKLPPQMPVNNKSRSSSEPFDWIRETREIAKDQTRTMRGSNAYKMMDMTDNLMDHRIKTTIAFDDEAVKRYKDYPALVNTLRDSAAYNWMILNLSAGNTYNMIESKYYLLCGAMIWILDWPTEMPGWRQKLYPLLP